MDMPTTITADIVCFYFDCTVIFLAVIANSFVLAAVVRCKFHLTGQRRFLISLNAGDLYMSIICAVTFAYQYYTATKEPEQDNNHDKSATPYALVLISNCSTNILHSLKVAAFYINLLNLCGMSSDHVVGIIYPMKYRQVMDTIFARLTVMAVWIISFALAFIEIPINLLWINQHGTHHENEETMVSKEPSFHNDQLEARLLFDKVFPAGEESIFNFAESNESYFGETFLFEAANDRTCILFTSETKMWFEVVVIGLAVVCFGFLIACYSLIFNKVSNRVVRTPNHQTRKLVATTFLFVFTFTMCWFPLLAYEFIALLLSYYDNRPAGESEYQEKELKTQNMSMIFIGTVLNSVLMIYPLVDPIIYAARIPAVASNIIRPFLSCFPRCSACCPRFIETNMRRNTITGELSARTLDRTLSVPARYPLQATASNRSGCLNPMLPQRRSSYVGREDTVYRAFRMQ